MTYYAFHSGHGARSRAGLSIQKLSHPRESCRRGRGRLRYSSEGRWGKMAVVGASGLLCLHTGTSFATVCEAGWLLSFLLACCMPPHFQA